MSLSTKARIKLKKPQLSSQDIKRIHKNFTGDKSLAEMVMYEKDLKALAGFLRDKLLNHINSSSYIPLSKQWLEHKKRNGYPLAHWYGEEKSILKIKFTFPTKQPAYFKIRDLPEHWSYADGIRVKKNEATRRYMFSRIPAKATANMNKYLEKIKQLNNSGANGYTIFSDNTFLNLIAWVLEFVESYLDLKAGK